MPVGLRNSSITLARQAAFRGLGDYIADRVCPPFPTDNQEFVTVLIDPKANAVRAIDDTRAPTADPVEFDFAVGRPTTFIVQDRTQMAKMPFEASANEVEALADKQTYVDLLAERVKIAKEKRLVDLATNMLTTSTLTSSPSTKWDDTGGTPIADMKDMISAAARRSGVAPDCAALGAATVRSISDSADFLDRMKHDGSAKDGDLSYTAQALARLWGLKEVIVGQSAVNTAGEDATPVFADVWGEKVLLFKKEPLAKYSRAIFGQTHWRAPVSRGGGGMYQGWYVIEEEQRISSTLIIRLGQYYDMKCLYGDDTTADAATLELASAHLFYNTLLAA